MSAKPPSPARTQTIPASPPANRLAGEASPYLLQHKFNPVDWRPWGQDAFAEARRRQVPIFLSVGYSTCYWCHVMERESFENAEIAARLNQAFVCIKVDREERPDVDDIYMAAVQAFSGRGGWPMSVFLEPESLKPFWAGTYFPAEERPGYGVPSLPRVIDGISTAWRETRAEVAAQAEELAAAVAERIAEIGEPAQLSREHISAAVGRLLRMHDRRYGGFGGENGESVGPKFPHPVYLDLLLETRAAAGDDATRQAIDLALCSTLDSMALGGIHDHLAGGFHRYSVDARWLVPHFEKMLYDNALLLSTYARAAITYNDPFYRLTAERTAEYILREMTLRAQPDSAHTAGQVQAFFSAQDAEVDHREGLNYLWTIDELRASLTPDDAELAARTYGLTAGPNFRDPHHPNEPARNVLFLTSRPDLTPGGNIDPRLIRINAALLQTRAGRKQPARDDKVITAWNSLTISALAEAGRLLRRPDWIAAASSAANFLLAHLRLPDGRLARALLAAPNRGTPSVPALFEDHAALLAALVHLVRADESHRDRWLSHARTLLAETEQTFADHPADADPSSIPAAFFDTPPLADRPDLFVRPRTIYDGAVPSPIGQYLHALIDLHALTQNPLVHDRAVAALRTISGYVARAPLGAANSTRALLRLLQTDTGAVRQTLLAAPVLTLDLDHMRNPDDLVEILAAHERITVSTAAPSLLPIRVRIKPGHHLNAAIPFPGSADSSSPTLIPFRISVINGTGVRAFVDYPEGDPAGVRGELRTYSGELDLTVVLERDGDWSGQPLLGVRYQVCTDTECFAPTSVELDVAIDRP